MDPFNTQVVSHIDDAKNWLDEAKDEYINSNRVRAEINLNLAQAEVKYIWELSRHRDVTTDSKPSPSRYFGQRNYWVAAAASILIVAFLGAGMYLKFGKPQAKVFVKGENQVAEKRERVKSVVSHPSLQPKLISASAPAPTKIASISTPTPMPTFSPAKEKRRPQMGQPGRTIGDSGADQRTVAISESKSETEKGNDLRTRDMTVKGAVPVSAFEPVKRNDDARNDAEKARESSVIPGKTAVVSLIVDEDALAREASNSLRSGKQGKGGY